MAILIPFRKRSLFIVSWCILVWKQKIYNISTNDFMFPPQISFLLYKCSPAFTFWKNIKLWLKKTEAGLKMQKIDWDYFSPVQSCSGIQGKIVQINFVNFPECVGFFLVIGKFFQKTDFQLEKQQYELFKPMKLHINPWNLSRQINYPQNVFGTFFSSYKTLCEWEKGIHVIYKQTLQT